MYIYIYSVMRFVQGKILVGTQNNEILEIEEKSGQVQVYMTLFYVLHHVHLYLHVDIVLFPGSPPPCGL